MADSLSRSQIVGHRIVAVYRSPWQDFDGISSTAVFVRLDNNVICGLQNNDEILSEGPILNEVFDETWSVYEDSYGIVSPLDRLITEVVISELLMGIGFVLDETYLFFMDSSYARVMPVVVRIGEFYKAEDLRTYWGHQTVSLGRSTFALLKTDFAIV